MRTPILWVAIAGGLGLAGCGDSPTCESALRALAKNLDADGRPDDKQLASGVAKCIEEKWSGDVRTCVSKATSMEKAADCIVEGQRAKPARRGKRSEAELNLDAIGKSAKASYIEQAEFPRGKAPLTPASSCCETPSKKCTATAGDWVGVDMWDRLDFEMTSDHFFRYSYESDGVTFVARAVGDLDCDGTEVTWEIRGDAVNGNPKTTLTEPSNRD